MSFVRFKKRRVSRRRYRANGAKEQQTMRLKPNKASPLPKPNNNTTVVYRKATHDDIEGMFMLANALLPVFYPRFFFRKIIDSPTGEGLCAFNEDGRLVGFILGDFDEVFIPKSLEKFSLDPNKAFCVMLVAVDKSYQSLGIGTHLITLILDPDTCSTILKADFAYLHVMTEHLRAIRLYEKMGFKRLLVWPKYYTLNPDRDAFIMYRVISEIILKKYPADVAKLKPDTTEVSPQR